MTKQTVRNQEYVDGILVADETVEVVEYPTAGESATLAARLVVLPLLEDLNDEQVESFTGLFPDWSAGIPVEVGEVYRWDGTLVEVIQAHTTQADWTPDVVPALFRIFRTPDMTEWIAGVAVAVGEEFGYDGSTWRVLQAHTTQVGWEPPNVPALWQLVD